MCVVSQGGVCLCVWLVREGFVCVCGSLGGGLCVGGGGEGEGRLCVGRVSGAAVSGSVQGRFSLRRCTARPYPG